MTDIERIARLCHEVNRIYCVSLGDTSQVPWEEASDHQKQSVRQGVIFLMSNRAATPKNSHESWMRAKVEAGWVWGPEKNEVTKTHPCMIPYEELPEEQRRKDDFFHTIVRGCIQ